MKQALESLTAQFDKPSDINKIPKSTLLQALAHPDAVAVASLIDPLVELTGLDLDEGYTVFDSEMTELYSEADDLETPTWGTTVSDQAWIQLVEFGDYAFVAYTETGGVERVLMLIRG
jgi:hypothetical protein